MESKLTIIVISIFSLSLIGCATPKTTTYAPDGTPLPDATIGDGTGAKTEEPRFVIENEAQAVKEAPAYLGVDGGTISPTENATAKRKASVTLVNKGKSALFNNQYAVASKNLESAISLDPQNPYAYYYIALLEYKQGQHQQALGHLQLAKINFEDSKWKSESYVMAGRIEEDLRDWPDAAKEYEAALQHTPGLIPAEDGLTRVKGRLTSFETLPGEEKSVTTIQPNTRTPATEDEMYNENTGE